MLIVRRLQRVQGEGEMKKAYRLILCILVLLLLFSVAYESAEVCHDCAGENCPICAILCVLSSFVLAGAILFVAYSDCRKGERKAFAALRKTFFAVTPVSLKNKLSD